MTRQMAKRYARASKREKTRMLDECANSAGPAGTPGAPSRRWRTDRRNGRGGPETASTGKAMVQPLRLVWAALDGPAGKRLAPFMPEAVEALEREGELVLDRRCGPSSCGSPPPPSVVS